MRAFFFPLVVLATLASGCASTEAPPVMQGDVMARYADNSAQVGIGGTLVAPEIAFEPCEAATLQGGPATFTFEGNEGAVTLDLPDAELCGIRIVVTELIIEAEDDGIAKTVVGQDFDFWVPGEAIPTEGGLVLQLGNSTWLEDFLPLAGEGTTTLNSEADEDLLVAFYDGLHQGSSLDAQNTIVEQNEAE
ncbi:MAG: hypothetical protein H6736_09330 [Alphaproteobacteria bacterium]|nr:hypothetical protein [Alphaproteobacteria bacterium]